SVCRCIPGPGPTVVPGGSFPELRLPRAGEARVGEDFLPQVIADHGDVVELSSRVGMHKEKEAARHPLEIFPGFKLLSARTERTLLRSSFQSPGPDKKVLFLELRTGQLLLWQSLRGKDKTKQHDRETSGSMVHRAAPCSIPSD